jgi:hypothetical protein
MNAIYPDAMAIEMHTQVFYMMGRKGELDASAKPEKMAEVFVL